LLYARCGEEEATKKKNFDRKNSAVELNIEEKEEEEEEKGGKPEAPTPAHNVLCWRKTFFFVFALS
jgi:hypothetical protein